MFLDPANQLKGRTLIDRFSSLRIAKRNKECHGIPNLGFCETGCTSLRKARDIDILVLGY